MIRRLLSAFALLFIFAGSVLIGVTLYRLAPFSVQEIKQQAVLRMIDSPLATSGISEDLNAESCLCAVRWNSCPCLSVTRTNTVDQNIYEALSPRLLVDSGVTQGFNQRLHRAVGYATIQLDGEGDDAIYHRRSAPFRTGILDEYILDYRVPNQDVRALFATQEGASKLLIVTLGSFTTPELILGIGEQDYHLGIGQHFFDQGLDIIAFDHGSNGTIETMRNVDALIQGTQIYGLWAKSVCDFLDRKNLRAQYDEIYMYGLSRGGRVVEYTAALCPGLTLGIVGDNLSPDNLLDYHWNAELSGPHLKYGAWYGHVEPLIGRTTILDFMNAAQSPLVYTRAEKQYDWYPEVFSAFDVSDDLAAGQDLRFITKQTAKHVPELETIELMMAGEWSQIEGYALLLTEAGQ